jgi:uncharacterized protein (TIGR00290 family)
MKEKAIVSWSGGKDSALALHEARQRFDVVALVTTLTQEYDRISMHGVRSCLLDLQGDSLGIPIEKVFVSPACTNEEYEIKMRQALERHRLASVSTVICGDIFLEDVRRYREARLLGPAGMLGAFPLWHRDSRTLARSFIDSGFKARLCCVDLQALDRSFAGREYDDSLIADLPDGVDPCGENGEFHSFVFDGPDFAIPVRCVTGETVLRHDRFFYCDLLPA